MSIYILVDQAKEKNNSFSSFIVRLGNWIQELGITWFNSAIN